jgi:hypothetical protein
VDLKEEDRDAEVLVAITRDGKFYLGQEDVRVPDRGIEIRVRNASNVDFKDVLIGGEKFGDIKQDAASEYRKSNAARRYASVSLLANSIPLETQPVVYGADAELGHGRFTYVLTIQDGRLHVYAEKDKD